MPYAIRQMMPMFYVRQCRRRREARLLQKAAIREAQRESSGEVERWRAGVITVSRQRQARYVARNERVRKVWCYVISPDYCRALLKRLFPPLCYAEERRAIFAAYGSATLI